MRSLEIQLKSFCTLSTVTKANYCLCFEFFRVSGNFQTSSLNAGHTDVKDKSEIAANDLNCWVHNKQPARPPLFKTPVYNLRHIPELVYSIQTSF